MQHASFNPGFPVYIYDGEMELPKEGTYFLVAGNGLWLHKDMPNFRGFVPVDNISLLTELDANSQAESKLPKLPARHVWRIKQFFKEIVRRYHSEACTVLYFNRDTGEWKIHVPKQRVSHGGVQYQRVGAIHLEGMEGFTPVGTIHSHCDFGAFHSGVDERDEQFFDGLHVTFGHNDRDEFTISASVVINGHRQKVDPLSVLEGVRHVGGEVYSLIDLDHDPEFHEWADGLDKWVSQVEGTGYRNYWGLGSAHRFKPPFAKGDRVAWRGDSVTLVKSFGAGPFEVVSWEDGKLTISTDIGFAKLSDKLFKKEQ